MRILSNSAKLLLGPVITAVAIYACSASETTQPSTTNDAGVAGAAGAGGDAGSPPDGGDGGEPPGDAQAPCDECISFRVSAPVPVLWTGGSVPIHVPDNLFVVLARSDGYLGFVSGNRNTYALSAASLLGLGQSNFDPDPVIAAGPVGQFDDCGAWLHSVAAATTPSVVRGWYHAEGGGDCNGTGGGTHIKAIAYVESADSGTSFSKVGYPGNVVLTASPAELAQATTTNVVGVGDFTVLERDDDYHLFYLNAAKAESCAAKASVASGGVPGSWQKWHEGSFSQPGLGGEDTGLGLQLAGVSLNSALNQFVGLTYGKSGTVGFKVAMSTDGIDWTILDAPLVPGGTRWADSPTAAPNAGVAPFGYSQYQTIIAPNGAKTWSDRFYVYYVYVRPGEGFTMRFLLRSEVKLELHDAPLSRPKVSTALNRYFSQTAQKHWVTSELAVPTTGTWDFQGDGSVGEVFTSSGAGLVELADCVYDDDHYVVTTGGVCGDGATKLRTIGWIYSHAAPQPPDTHAIYRCHQPAIESHFVSTSADCEGATTEGLLGYALDS